VKWRWRRNELVSSQQLRYPGTQRGWAARLRQRRGCGRGDDGQHVVVFSWLGLRQRHQQPTPSGLVRVCRQAELARRQLAQQGRQQQQVGLRHSPGLTSAYCILGHRSPVRQSTFWSFALCSITPLHFFVMYILVLLYLSIMESLVCKSVQRFYMQSSNCFVALVLIINFVVCVNLFIANTVNSVTYLSFVVS